MDSVTLMSRALRSSPPSNTRMIALTLTLLAALTATPTRAVTLAEAVTGALQVEQQESRVAALRGESAAIRRQAGGLLAADPALRAKSVSDALTGNDGAYELEAMVDLPLWMPGQRSASQGIATAMGNQADALVRLLRWEMAGRVREAAWTTALAQGRLRQAAAALAAARSLEQDIGKRTMAGELARMDLLVAQQDTLTREVDLQAAQLDYNQAIQSYIHLTGLRTVPEPLVETAPPPSGTPTEAHADLPADHPLLASSDGAVAKARAERERVHSQRRGNPLLSLGAKRVRDGRGSEAADALQLEISVPFGLTSYSAPAIALAERAYTEEVTTRRRTLIEAEHALETARIEVAGATEALALATRRQTVTQDAVQLVRRAFNLGESELTTLLQAQERARQASLDLELRRLEQGRAAARLNQALGLVPE